MMAAVRRVLLSSAAVVCLALTACGDGPTPEPSGSRPDLDPSGEPVALRGGGSIDVPASWTITQAPGPGPELLRATSGQGTIAVWRYPRSEPLPRTRSDMRNARRNLREAIIERDKDFKVNAAILHDDPELGVEIAGIGTLAGSRRAIRSLHIYANASETVVDCIGPIGDAAQFDTTICVPVLESLSVG